MRTIIFKIKASNIDKLPFMPKYCFIAKHEKFGYIAIDNRARLAVMGRFANYESCINWLKFRW